ncbi:hypothetical protein J6590_089670 [Homalodisca vitripennis]|nr:hypothetical protein J6590_089670 [Homalodisca vitripennis]
MSLVGLIGTANVTNIKIETEPPISGDLGELHVCGLASCMCAEWRAVCVRSAARTHRPLLPFPDGWRVQGRGELLALPGPGRVYHGHLPLLLIVWKNLELYYFINCQL